VAGKQEPADVLAFALLKRAADDQRVFAGTVSYGDNNDLQVDLENSSLQWGAKQCNVGVLWRYVCKCCSSCVSIACLHDVTVADCIKANAAAVICCAVKQSDIATAGYELLDLGC